MSIWWSDGWEHSSWPLTERITVVRMGRGEVWERVVRGDGSPTQLHTTTDDQSDFANNFNSDRQRNTRKCECIQYSRKCTVWDCAASSSNWHLYQNNNKVIDFILYFDTNCTKHQYDIKVVEFTLISDGNGLSVTYMPCQGLSQLVSVPYAL